MLHLIYIYILTAIIGIDSLSTQYASPQDSIYSQLTPAQVDSLTFRLSHHYSVNYNFVVKADSLTLIPREGDLITDTCRIYDGELIAVAEIRMEPGDSIDSVWVKVAHDQYTMGWIAEHELLAHTTPDDTISQILDSMTSTRGIWMVGFIVIGVLAFLIRKRKNNKLLIMQLDQMNSPYPIALIINVAILASLYASVQNLVPEFWQEYYYHPTLNPLQLPPLMALLVTLVWLTIILLVACVDEVYHHFYAAPGIIYLAELLGLAMLTYILISQLTLIYIGYPVLLALIIAMVYWYHTQSKKVKSDTN